MTDVIDFQVRQLYAAEATLWGSRFSSLDDVQAYVDRVVGSRSWSMRRSEITSVRVVAPRQLGLDGSRGHVLFRSGKWYLALPTRCRFERYVLHELAHLLAFRPGEAYHGPRFARQYLLLVQREMGSEAAEHLQRKFVEHGVRTLESSPSAL